MTHTEKSPLLLPVLEEYWTEKNMDDHLDRCPPGWRTHFLVILSDIVTTLKLNHEQVKHLFDQLTDLFINWRESYPDPTLFTYLACLKRYRPEQYQRYLSNHHVVENTPEFNINAATFELTIEITGLFSDHANPMRMRDAIYEIEDMIHDFVLTHKSRCISPFDGRSTDEIYALTTHLGYIIKSIESF
ncbi:MAG: hypothetical protein HQL54_01170 [Magnetococcales bacterium]|nr:hypothetical protein [Magnetococcales bacterium]